MVVSSFAPSPPQTLPTVNPTKRDRLAGLDVARSVAIFGMLVAHFAYSVRGEDGALGRVARFTDGRAMPLFVVLGGVGITLLTARAKHPDRALLGRAAVLLVAGLLLEARTNVLVILHFYALFFVAGVVLRRLPGWALLTLAAVSTAIGSAVALAEPEWSTVRETLADQSTTFGIVPVVVSHPFVLLTDLVATGGYPLFPTLAFVTVGMWLGRQRLSSVPWQAGLVAAGVALFTVGYGSDWLVDQSRADLVRIDEEAGRVRIDADARARIAEEFGIRERDLVANAESALADGVRPAEIDAELTNASLDPGDPLNVFDGTGHSHQPSWVVGATGFALAVIGLALGAARLVPSLFTPLAAAGRLALTFYVTHLIALIRVQDTWPGDRSPGDTFTLLGVAFAGFAVLATAWLRFVPYGPLEALLRLAGGGFARRTQTLTVTPPVAPVPSTATPDLLSWPAAPPTRPPEY